MGHLTDEQLYNWLTEHSLPAEARSHLAGCEYCKEQIAAGRRLLTEMQIARRSQLGAERLGRYYQLFDRVQQKPSGWSALWEQVKLSLTLDSRRQTALAGLRSGSQGSYRLLYSDDAVAVEMLIEASGDVRNIEGEILSVDVDDVTPPALVELIEMDSHRPGASAESADSGRFRLERVATGQYDMIITPVRGPSFKIEEIAIT